MTLIDDEQEARTLARTLVSQLRLFGEDGVVDIDDPHSPTQLETAQGMFRARVAPRFQGIFEEERRAPAPVTRSPPWLAVVLVLLVVAAVAFLYLRH